MTLFFILGVFLMWLYVFWVIRRRGNIEPDEDMHPDHRNSTREASERESKVFYRRRK